MIVINKLVEVRIYISEEEIAKRAEQWGETVEDLIEGLENESIDPDDFSNVDDYEVIDYKLTRE